MTLEKPPIDPSRLVPCPDCKKLVSKDAGVCPHCGLKLKKTRTDKAAKAFSVIFIWAVIALVIVYVAWVYGRYAK